MEVLANNWTDEAREASLEVRRARAKKRTAERRRDAFLAENPDATEADWILEQERKKDERSFKSWQKVHPEGTREEWLEHVAQNKKFWRDYFRRKEQAQWEEQRTGKRRSSEPFVENWIPREEDGAVVPSYYDDVTEKLIPLPRDAWPEHLRWDQGLKQGEVLDPHWGAYGPDAPYGYHDGTGEPREEPLYDANGYPIVPREPLKSRHGRSAEDYQSDEDWRQRSEVALERWGRWGQKRKWMRKHAGLGEADWQEYARKKWGDGE